MALSLLSLAGIPPLVGFIGKVLVAQALLDGGLAWLAVTVIANMVIRLYNYVVVAAEMYLKEPSRERYYPGKTGYSISALISMSGTLLLGMSPVLALQLKGLLSRRSTAQPPGNDWLLPMAVCRRGILHWALCCHVG